MDPALQILSSWGAALLGWALNPFYYIGLLLIALLYRRQVTMERRMFYTRLHAPAGEWVHALLFGLLGGLLVSAVGSTIGFVFTMSTMLWLWAVTLVLGIFRIKYLCLAYASGIVIMLHELASWFPAMTEVPGLESLLASLYDIHPPSLLALVALLHLLEAALLRQRDGRSATALITIGKRGKLIGMYQHHGLWAVPLFLVLPASSGAGIDVWWPWPFMLGGAEWGAGWTLMAAPMLIGMTGISVERLPKAYARAVSAWLWMFAAVVGGLAAVVELWPLTAALAAIAVPVLHELIAVLHERREMKGKPYFVSIPAGMRVFGVVPGSPAAQMGIACGEVIVKANSIPVHTKEQLHAALRTNSAFCKLEIADLNNESRFVQRALFDGDHHQLGIILCPDEDAPHYMLRWPLTVLSFFSAGVRGRFSEATAVQAPPPIDHTS